MKTKLALAAALALVFTSTAIAQAPPPPADAAPKDDARMAPNDEGTMSDDPDDADDMASPPDDARGPARMAGPKGPRPRGGPGWRRGMMMPPPPPPPSKAAEFRIRNGPFRFEVRCAEDEPMQACADIATKLLDQAKTLSAPAR